MRPLAKNIREVRRMKNWSQETAATIIGISRPTLGSYEEDRAQPPAEVLIKICNAFGVTDIPTFVNGSIKGELEISPFEQLFNKLDPRSKKAVEVLMGM